MGCMASQKPLMYANYITLNYHHLVVIFSHWDSFSEGLRTTEVINKIVVIILKRDNELARKPCNNTLFHF